ncbi:DUF883 family protein [Aquicoccus porphyridii]|uniref:DUF883 family protein n=1 Tax=Aquicoccus porphyridii TaxID=1852029 RepID=A0A5A9ZUU1_9RHOB|nr:DUF883 family protein [Aquicoccus porphyridii]KAA0920692.1 DUF883 family protein [Aquicoccus porphyridii]RAI56755.1 hypothetical protein DOO74_02585 [Rhodobacteraceae bacterium AsT-22]
MSTSNAAARKDAPHTDDLSHQIETLRADVSKLMATVSDDVSDGIGEAGRQIGQTGRDARRTATNTVTEHPLAAVGIAAGIGLLLGLVARKG